MYVAGCFGISVGMVDQLRRDGKLHAIKIGRRVLFELSAGGTRREVAAGEFPGPEHTY
mgnify:CR=1 FL=1